MDLLGYGERVINLDSEIADRALDLRVAQQELNRSKTPDTNELRRSCKADGEAVRRWRVLLLGVVNREPQE